MERDLLFSYKELFPIVIATHIWGHQWFWRNILFRSDNQAVVHILTTKTSKVQFIMQLLRKLLGSAAPPCLHVTC